MFVHSLKEVCDKIDNSIAILLSVQKWVLDVQVGYWRKLNNNKIQLIFNSAWSNFSPPSKSASHFKQHVGVKGFGIDFYLWVHKVISLVCKYLKSSEDKSHGKYSRYDPWIYKEEDLLLEISLRRTSNRRNVFSS